MTGLTYEAITSHGTLLTQETLKCNWRMLGRDGDQFEQMQINSNSQLIKLVGLYLSILPLPT